MESIQSCRTGCATAAGLPDLSCRDWHRSEGEMADNAKISKTFFILNGEPAGTRTPGPKIKSLMLYQLSYGLTPPG